ncbi:MAG: radical SAM protein [Parcubacteria group bacterium Gr01-1014_31]|nr:MAG: radical SAM protein [Parcubacteria group bacterium Gr01-1014_31]
MRRILIVNPNLYSSRATVMRGRHRPPLDLAYIAALLRNDFEVRLVDARVDNLDVCQMYAEVAAYSPEVLITTTTPVDRWECPQSYLESFFSWLGDVANLPTKPVIIVTGTHGTTQPDWLLRRCPSIDFLVRGEPERTCEALVRAIAAGGHPSVIAGVSYRQEEKILHNQAAPRILDLDALPLPAYDLLPMGKYRYTFGDIPQPFSIVLATRGCPYRCTFCCRVMMENAYVTRKPQQVYDELKYLRERFGVRGIFFQDWEFTINKFFVNALMDLLLAKPLGITWGCNARANDFQQPQLFEKMQRAGLVRVNIGFESGSPEVLEAVNKKITVDDLARAIEVTRRLKLHLGMYALLNAPGETAKTIRETMAFLKRQGISSMNFNLVVPYFGTAVHEQLREQLGPEAAEHLTWDTIEEYAGRTRTQLPPWLARLYQRHTKYRLSSGPIYWLRPAVWAEVGRKVVGRMHPHEGK